uniref:Uncharacterized protein n=1 Tax=viral metagenome TaxID=1070528 RepID=A0A6C0CME0_9ZZZZ
MDSKHLINILSLCENFRYYNDVLVCTLDPLYVMDSFININPIESISFVSKWDHSNILNTEFPTLYSRVNKQTFKINSYILLPYLNDDDKRIISTAYNLSTEYKYTELALKMAKYYKSNVIIYDFNDTHNFFRVDKDTISNCIYKTDKIFI